MQININRSKETFYLKLWFLIFSICSPSQSFSEADNKAEVTSTVQAQPETPDRFYGVAELRHHLNSYYDQDGYLDHQDPAGQARLKLGIRFYEGAVDAYATVGVIKIPQTQQLVQRRTELEVDIYPARWEWGKVVQYNLVQLPYSEQKYDESATEESKQGSIYTLGVAPLLFHTIMAGETKIILKTGVDYWTTLFSRKQYRQPDSEDEPRDHFTAVGSEDEEYNDREDAVLHYFSEYMAGVSISPSILRRLIAEGNAYYDCYFLPKYELTADGSEQYHYSAERHSYYRLRLQFALTERTWFINDFYHYHEGFFSEQVVGEKRRFRNIARISYQM